MRKWFTILLMLSLLLLSCTSNDTKPIKKTSDDKSVKLETPENILSEKDSIQIPDSINKEDIKKEDEDLTDEENEANIVCEKDVCESNSLKRCILKKTIYSIDCPHGCLNAKCIEKKVKSEEYLIEGLFIGMNWGKDVKVITSSKLKNLDSFKFSTGIAIAEYKQNLRLYDSDVDGGIVVFEENNDKKFSDYLKFKESDDIFEYSLVFTKPMKSAINSNQLKDFVGKTLNIMGDEFEVANANIDTARKSLTIDLIGKGINDILLKGESKTYTVGGQEVTIEVLSINKDTVKLTMNGETTGSIKKYDVYTTSFGVSVNINEILLDSNGKDMIAFQLGGTKITFNDDDYIDNIFDNDVSIDGIKIKGAKVRIRGSVSNHEFNLVEIAYKIKFEEDDIFLIKGDTLSEHVESPRLLLSSKWEITYNGLSDERNEPVKFISKSNGYELEFVNTNGDEYENIPFIDASGTYRFGGSSKALVFVEGTSATDFTINKDDYIVLTDENDYKGETIILQFDRIDLSSKKIIFNDPVGSQKTSTYSDSSDSNTLGTGTITVGGKKHYYAINADGTKIAMSLNDDESIDQDVVDIVVSGGGILHLANSQTISNDKATVSLKTEKRNLKSANADEIINILFKKSGSDVKIEIQDQAFVEMHTKNKGSIGMSSYGAMFTLDDDDLFIDYPQKQRLASVTIAFKD